MRKKRDLVLHAKQTKHAIRRISELPPAVFEEMMRDHINIVLMGMKKCRLVPF